MILDTHFDKTINQDSPVQKDYQRKVNYDENGEEYITYEEIDYSEIIAANGSALDWSLNALLKAGINPDFGIHTGNPTRLEGLNTLNTAEQYVEQLFTETQTTDTK